MLMRLNKTAATFYFGKIPLPFVTSQWAQFHKGAYWAPLRIFCNEEAFSTVPSGTAALFSILPRLRLNTSLQCTFTATRCCLLATCFHCYKGKASNFFPACLGTSRLLEFLCKTQCMVSAGSTRLCCWNWGTSTCPPYCVNNLQSWEDSGGAGYRPSSR